VCWAKRAVRAISASGQLAAAWLAIPSITLMAVGPANQIRRRLQQSPPHGLLAKAIAPHKKKLSKRFILVRRDGRPMKRQVIHRFDYLLK